MDAKRPGDRGGWLTLLDLVVVVVAAAALVALLGAQGRFTLAGARVTIRSPLNLCLAAGVLIVLRLAIARRRRLFPAVPVPDRSRFETERARLASPQPWSRQAVLCAAAAV